VSIERVYGFETSVLMVLMIYVVDDIIDYDYLMFSVLVFN
jgi:hypothetical protein